MTIDEALQKVSYFEQQACTNYPPNQEFQLIEAMEIAKKALIKSKPEVPEVVQTDDGRLEIGCPNCGFACINFRKREIAKWPYCPACGQALNWETDI